MSSNVENSISFDSFFAETIKDNNGKTVTDINAGLVNLYDYFNNIAPLLYPREGYIVAEFEDGFPDLVARNCYLGNQSYWWWILLLNRLDNPFTDIKANRIYSINDNDTIDNFISESNITKEQQTTSRVGSIVELN